MILPRKHGSNSMEDLFDQFFNNISVRGYSLSKEHPEVVLSSVMMVISLPITTLFPMVVKVWLMRSLLH